MQILERWMQDIPQQFLGKHNIEVLISALAKQYQEVYDVLTEINEKTDLDNATGINLDYIGSIVGLTRKQAGLLCGSPPEYVLSDERYRSFLRYQILVNTNECTYYDLIAGAELLWDVDQVLYIEDPNYPATIILEVPLKKRDGTPTVIGEAPIIKPGGVAVLYQFRIEASIVVSEKTEPYSYSVPFCGQNQCGTYPIPGTKGNTSGKEIEVSVAPEPTAYTTRVSGTYPDLASVGGTIEGNADLLAAVSWQAITPNFCNTRYCGEEV